MPAKSYDNLPECIEFKEVFNSASPTLAQIKNYIHEDQAVFIVSLAIQSVNLMFREDRRMTDTDVVRVAKRIVRQYWYLKPEDLKKCFEGRRPKSFVLEGDSFLSWLAEYDLQRDRACEDYEIGLQKEESSQDSITYKQYLDNLKAQASKGDDHAIEMLKHDTLIKQQINKYNRNETRKEKDFQIFRLKYEASKRQKSDDKQ